MISQLFSWFRKERKGSQLHVTLYTHEGCCLCTDALNLLETEKKGHNFKLTVIDIAADADLVARYGLTIPVVLVNGKERFRGAVNAVLLRRLLNAEQGP